MLPKDAKKDLGANSYKVLHIKCTSFTSKKTNSCFEMIQR